MKQKYSKKLIEFVFVHKLHNRIIDFFSHSVAQMILHNKRAIEASMGSQPAAGGKFFDIMNVSKEILYFCQHDNRQWKIFAPQAKKIFNHQ